MFSIFKKKPAHTTIDLSAIVTDMHSHLLPGIDDGSPDMETSLYLIKGLQDLGYKNLITSPHILWDLYKNTNEIIQTKKQEVKAALQQAGNSVCFSAAAEYFMDDHLDELLEKDVPLLTIQDNKVLVEFSFVSAPMDWKEKLFKLQIKGYQPILAHPERYSYYAGDKKMFEELKTAGFLFQVNLLSLTGYYNKIAKDLATHLIQHNMVDCVGTDLHHDRHLEALRNAGFIMPLLHKMMDSGKILNPGFSPC